MSDSYGNIPIAGPDQAAEEKAASAPSKVVRHQKKAAGKSQAKFVRQQKRSLPKKYSRKKILLRMVIILATLFTVYSMAGFIAIPYYFSHILPKRIAKTTGLQLHTAEVHFNPYTLNFIAEGVSLEDTGEKPLLFIDSLNARIALLPLLRAEWVCTEFMIRRVQLHIIRDANRRYNIGRLARKIQEKSVDELTDFSTLPFYFSLNNIDIQQGSLLFTDLLTAKKHRVEEIFLRIPTISNFSHEIAYYVSPYFSATINGTPMEMTGKDSANPGTLTTTFTNLSLKHYLPYLPPDLPFLLQDGILNGTVDIAFNAAPGSSRKRSAPRGKALSCHFDFTLTELAVQGREGRKEEAFFPQITVQGDYQAINNTLALSRASFKAPEFSVQLPAEKTLLHRLLQKSTTKASPSSSISAHIPDNRAFFFHLKEFDLSQGQITLTTATHRKVWHNINFQATNLHADTRHPEQAAEKEQETGSFELQATITKHPIQNTEEATRIHLQGSLLPYHRSGIPHCAATTITIDNLHDLGEIFQIAGLESKNSEEFSFSAQKIQLGPITTHTAELGTLRIDGGKLKITPDHVPLPLHILLQTTPPLFQLTSVYYNGELNTTLHHGATVREISIPQLQLEMTGAWSKTMQTRFQAILANEQTVPEPPEIQGEGELTLAPFSLQGSLLFHHISLATEPALSLLPTDTSHISGLLAGKGKFSLPAGDFSGNIEIAEGKLLNTSPAMSWKQLIAEQLDIKNFSNKEKRSVTLQQLTLRGLSSRLHFDQTTSPLVSTSSFVAPLTRTSDNILNLYLLEGELTLEDHRLSPPWSATLKNLQGTISPLQNSAGSESEIALGAELGTGRLDLKGTATLNNPEHDARLVFTGTAIPLSLFAEQLRSDKLLNPSRGEAGFTLNTLWLNGKMSSRGTLSVADIEAVEPTSGIATALMLLGGAARHFTLDQQLATSPDQPTAPLFLSLYQNLRKRLIRAEVSPLLVAGEEFRSLAGEQQIPFPPGEKEPTPEGQEIVEKYFKLLQSYPTIHVTFSASQNNKADHQALLKKAREKEMVQRKKRDRERQQLWEEEKTRYEAEQRLAFERENGTSIISSTIPKNLLQPPVPEPIKSVKVSKETDAKLARDRLAYIEREYKRYLSPAEHSRITLKKASIEQGVTTLPGLQISLQPATMSQPQTTGEKRP